MRQWQTRRIRAAFVAAVLLLVPALVIPADESSPAQAAEEVDADVARLEAIGGLSAINAQHTFLLIGVVSDAHIKGIYEPKQVRSMMNGVIRQLETLSGLLRKLKKGNLSEEDNEYLERVLAMHVRLQTQARALNSFVEKKGESEARAFEKSRQSSLRELERLLGAATENPVADEKEAPGKESSDSPSSEKSKQE